MMNDDSSDEETPKNNDQETEETEETSRWKKFGILGTMFIILIVILVLAFMAVLTTTVIIPAVKPSAPPYTWNEHPMALIYQQNPEFDRYLWTNNDDYNYSEHWYRKCD